MGLPTLLTWFSWLEIFWTMEVLTVFFYFFLKSSDSTSERYSHNELLKVRHKLDKLWPKMAFVGVGFVWLLLVMVTYIAGIVYAHQIGGVEIDPAVKVGLGCKFLIPLAFMLWFLAIIPLDDSYKGIFCKVCFWAGALVCLSISSVFAILAGSSGASPSSSAVQYRSS